MWLVVKLVDVPIHSIELGNVVRPIGKLVVVALVWIVVLLVALVIVLAFELGPMLELELVPM